MTLLDKIDDVKDLEWRGCTNELNAAYAVDGYSRVRGNVDDSVLGFGALVTTFGVGELSAINGVAGSYAENVGMVHVVGIPLIDAQNKQLLLHHTLGNGDFTVFREISKRLSNTTGILDDPANAPDVIDRVIRDAYIHQKPTYLAFPTNMVEVEVPKSRLDKPIDLSIPKNDEDSQEEVLETILDMIEKAKDPVIIVDACCGRHNVSKEAKELIEVTNFKFAVTPMAKGSRFIDENHPNFAGVYVGSLSYPDVKKSVEEADLVLSLGAILSDFNTGAFSYSLDTRHVVEFHSGYTKIRNAQFPGVRMKELVGKLASSTKLKNLVQGFKPKIEKLTELKSEVKDSDAITHKHFWTSLSGFFKDGDVIITETGTSSFGILQSKYPTGAFGISQVLWGSIGYSVGSAYGAATAVDDYAPERRVILFVGDGSLQLTATEISSMVRHNLKPYLFVLNNEGYTIERLIHGPEQEYNSIQPWDHQLILPLFKAKESESVALKKVGELRKLLSAEDFNRHDKIRLIEVFFSRMDAPENLVKQAELSSKLNSG